jgi:hypothetical protein
MLLCTVWLGAIGFIDDYLKIKAKRIAKEKGIDFKKTNADGLAGKFKIFGQVMLGLVVGATLYFNQSVVVKREVISKVPYSQNDSSINKTKFDVIKIDGKERVFTNAKNVITTIPFVKGHEFNYAKLLPKSLEQYTYILYILIVIFIVTAVSNGANITDGLDGLASPDLKELISRVSTSYSEYQSDEVGLQINSGTDYTIHYDMVTMAIQWTKVENPIQAKEFVGLYLEPDGNKIFLGEFVKAILKIVNIANELIKITKTFGMVELEHKLTQIPGLLLKFVATNQSLYV